MIHHVFTPFALTDNYTVPVNLVGVMGAGLAKATATTYPGAVAAYQEDLRRRVLQEGTVTAWQTPAGNHLLFVPTKRHWRDPSPLDLVVASIGALFECAHRLGLTTLHIPRLGCGLGRLDWRTDVRPQLIHAATRFPALHAYLHQ